jgi:hypothetical protein
MENILGGLAFAGIIAGQFLAIVAVHKAKWEKYCRGTEGSGQHETAAEARTRHIWHFAS